MVNQAGTETGSCSWHGGLARSASPCLWAFKILSFRACPGCLGGSKTDLARGFPISWQLVLKKHHHQHTIQYQAHICLHAAGPGQGPRSTHAQWVVSAAQTREPLPSSCYRPGDSRSRSPLRREGLGWQRKNMTCYPYRHLSPRRGRLLGGCDRVRSPGRLPRHAPLLGRPAVARRLTRTERSSSPAEGHLGCAID